MSPVADQRTDDQCLVEAGALVAQLGFDAETAEVVTADEVDIDTDIVIDNDRIIDVQDDAIVQFESKFVSSTIIAPPSTPTYQALSTATAGVAKAVEASAAKMASFRIEISPFTCIPYQNCPNTL